MASRGMVGTLMCVKDYFSECSRKMYLPEEAGWQREPCVHNRLVLPLPHNPLRQSQLNPGYQLGG